MTEQERYYEKDYDELYYIFDSKTLSEKEFEEKVEYDGYDLFAHSLTSKEVVDLLNENEGLNHHLSELQGQNEILNKENEKLKKENKTLTVQKLEIRKWVNDKISDLEKKYEFGQTEYKGCPMHNIQFGINILKELQEYWEEQEND